MCCAFMQKDVYNITSVSPCPPACLFMAIMDRFAVHILVSYRVVLCSVVQCAVLLSCQVSTQKHRAKHDKQEQGTENKKQKQGHKDREQQQGPAGTRNKNTEQNTRNKNNI